MDYYTGYLVVSLVYIGLAMLRVASQYEYLCKGCLDWSRFPTVSTRGMP